MKKSLKKNRFNQCLFVFSATFCLVLNVQTSQSNQISVNFDSLFPLSWYEKGLNAAIYIWHTLADACQNNHGVVGSPDKLLSKLALAQFSVGRMVSDQIFCLPEDKVYFGAVLNKIKELIHCVMADDDFVLCVGEMVVGIEKELESF